MGLTYVTRTAIVDELMMSGLAWAGRMDEQDFLARLYPVNELPSTDTRYRTADGARRFSPEVLTETPHPGCFGREAG